MVTITKDYIQLGIVVLMFLVFIYWDIKKYRVIKWEKVPRNNQKYIKKREKNKFLGKIWANVIHKRSCGIGNTEYDGFPCVYNGRLYCM